MRVTSATFDFEAFTTAPGSSYDFVQAVWDELANSTSGDAELKVARP